MEEKFYKTVELLERASDTTEINDLSEKERYLIDILAEKSDNEVLKFWNSWIEKDAFYLHMLIPKIYLDIKNPSDRLSLWILKAGVEYDEPSYNRYFIESSVHRLGAKRVLEYYLSKMEEYPQGVSSALYWVSCNKDDKEVKSLMDKIKRSLCGKAKPWWKIW